MSKTTTSIGQILLKKNQLLNRVGGKILLHNNHPDEFEYYMFALELVDSRFKTLDYFIFPILPNNLNFDDTPVTKIVKTAGGISVLKNKQFIPHDLSVSGTFGRSFKVLIGNQFQNLVSNFNKNDKSIKGKIKSIKDSIKGFNASVKTGYGCTKVLENIINSSNQPDEFNKSKYLILYNLAFNQQFFVECISQSYSMSQDSNMIWQYSLKFKTLGYANSYFKNKTKELLTNIFIQKKSNAVYNEATSLLNKTIGKFI